MRFGAWYQFYNCILSVSKTKTYTMIKKKKKTVFFNLGEKQTGLAVLPQHLWL